MSYNDQDFIVRFFFNIKMLVDMFFFYYNDRIIIINVKLE